jgi:hypothetical protein
MKEHRSLVMADASGKILAAYASEKQEPNAPTHVTLVGSQDQVVREVEVPEELRQAGLSAELLRKYRLKVLGDGAELVAVSDTDPPIASL